MIRTTLALLSPVMVTTPFWMGLTVVAGHQRVSSASMAGWKLCFLVERFMIGSTIEVGKVWGLGWAREFRALLPHPSPPRTGPLRVRDKRSPNKAPGSAPGAHWRSPAGDEKGT